MTPSKEAIEAALGQVTVYGSREKEDMLDALNAFIAIDVAPLEQRIAELEENWLKYAYNSDRHVKDGMREEIVRLEQKVEELEAELNLVDMSLARRERLDDCKDRYSKIEKMCSENGRLEAENQRLKAQVVKLIRENSLIEEQLEHFKDCYAELASLYDKAQLERKPLNAFACPRCGMVGQGEHVCEATPRPA